MSFNVIAARHPKDKDFPDRVHTLLVRHSLLNGTFYDHQPYSFETEYVAGELTLLQDRKPSVPTGSNQLRVVVEDHVSMLFGDSQFPEVDTENAEARKIAKDLIKDAGLVEKLRVAARYGAVGSVAIHLKVLQRPKGKARMFVDVHKSTFLTPEYDEYEPDVLVRVIEKVKAKGFALRAAGYTVKEEHLNVDFWCQREWDALGEWWFTPWLVRDDSKPADYVHVPQIDHERSVTHDLGFCPWVWIGGPDAIDGQCTFEAGIEHAIQIDMLDSQVTRALKYTMDPTLLMKVPGRIVMPEMVGPETTESAGKTPQGTGIAKSPSTILTIDAEGDAGYLEIAGTGLEAAQNHLKRMKSALIEAIHGDRVNPEEVTQGHQGAKSLEMLNASLLMHTTNQRAVYGVAFLRLLRMALQVIALKPVSINGEAVSVSGSYSDLSLRWGDFYALTPSEELAIGQALTAMIDAGVLSKETGTKVIAGHYNIENVSQERAKIDGEQSETEAKEVRLAAAGAAAKQKAAPKQENGSAS